MTIRSSYKRALVYSSAVLLAFAGFATTVSAVRSATGRDSAGASRAGGTVLLTKDVPKLSPHAALGGLPAGAQVRVAVMLSDPNKSAEQALYRDLYSQGSPLFHRFLTPAQYESRFGISAAQRSAVQSWLERGGLSVKYSGGTGRYWVAAGPAAKVEALFGVQLRQYHGASGTFYANDRAPRVPVALGISGVSLTDALKMHTHQDVPNPTFNATPSDLWGMYEMPSSDSGQGEQLGIIGAGYLADPDPSKDLLTLALRDFEANNSLPQIPLRIVYPLDQPTSDSGGLVEWELDTQASSGMAPGALDIDFYDAPSLAFSDITAAISYWAADPNGPHQASASLGGCEDNPAFDLIGAEYAAEMTAAELQAVNEGRTLFASTGDTGSGCIAGPLPVNGVLISPVTMPEMPAALPYTTAVGGTVLYPQLRSLSPGGVTIPISDPSAPRHRAFEYSWTHGGGGASHYETAPDYQQGTTNLNVPCLFSDSAGDPATSVGACRGVPDVAAMSGDIISDGYTLADRSGALCSPAPCTGPEGGTSLSSPLWLGMWARVQAAAPAAGLGFANETIYPAGKDSSRYANDFYDVTVGDNGAYQALPGWDYTTGWGVPRVSEFAADVTGNASLTPTHPTDVLPPLPTPGGGGTGGGGGGGGTPQPPITAAACTPLWTDPSGDDTFTGDLLISGGPSVDTGANPNMDLLGSSFSLSQDGSSLRTSLILANLDKTVQPYSQANIYFTVFSFGGTQYYGSAEVDPSGSVTYGYGTIASGGITPVGTASGALTPGPRGTVEIDIPLEDVGGPQVADALTNTGGETWALLGTNEDTVTQVPDNPIINASALDGFGLYQPLDISPTDSNSNFTGRNYQLGEICAPPVGTGVAITTIPKKPWTGTVARFADPRLSDRASEFQATIDWGDGTITTGTVSGANGAFSVGGSHSWRKNGTYTVTVTLRQVDDTARPAASAQSSAVVGRR